MNGAITAGSMLHTLALPLSVFLLVIALGIAEPTPT